jgi:hypothetical protein
MQESPKVRGRGGALDVHLHFDVLVFFIENFLFSFIGDEVHLREERVREERRGPL